MGSSDTSDSEVSSSEEEELRRRKSKKSKHSSSLSRKKKSKEKKQKKKSKKYRRRSTSSEDSSEAEDEWVELKQPAVPEVSKKIQPEEDHGGGLKGPEGKSETVKVAAATAEKEWNDFGDAFRTYSNDSKKAERRKQREQERNLRSIDHPGEQVNELNPYWKDGGTGLPEDGSERGEPIASSSSSQSIGDGGRSWLRKAYVRAKEQAKEEGRSLEDVISERWGSLEKFLELLEEAEAKAKTLESKSDRGSRSSREGRFIQPSRDSDDESADRSSRYSSHRHDSSRHKSSSRSRRRSRDRDSGSGWRKKSPDNRSRRSHSDFSPELKRKKVTPEHKPSAQGTGNRSPSPKEPRVSTFQKKPEVSKSPSPSPDQVSEQPPKEMSKILTDKEMNELNAKLMKAEMLGNLVAVENLRSKITEAEAARQEFIKGGGDLSQAQNKSAKVVTKVLMDNYDRRKRQKDKITDTHKDGQRVRYFPDDDKYSLQNMFQKEKLNTAADENALFARLVGKGAKTGLDYDIDDVFTDKASSSKQSTKDQEREVRDVLDEEKQYKKVLETCQWCFDSSVSEKHLILSVAEKSYLCVPPYQSLTEGHCLIVPISHASCSTELDEDVWTEMQKFRKALVRMFREADQDMVIFETAMYLKRHPHMYLECVPMPKETGELAPIYFKKAIQECETEWAQNKKLVDLRNRDVRRAVPKGLPYFSVDFGDDNCGFAHVVEDERNFPRNFAHEIIGGMMELDHHLWRKQKKDDFRTQRTKVMEFLKLWGAYDWTRDAN